MIDPRGHRRTKPSESSELAAWRRRTNGPIAIELTNLPQNKFYSKEKNREAEKLYTLDFRRSGVYDRPSKLILSSTVSGLTPAIPSPLPDPW